MCINNTGCEEITIFNGQDGKTLRSGAGVPSNSFGNDGDFYIDTTAHTLYGPKTAGSWGSPVSLVGPQGATGATGATGAQGPQGNAGTNGTNGADAVGIKYNYDTTITSVSTIASGKFAFQGDWSTFPIGGNGTIAFSDTDANGYAMGNLLAGLDTNDDGNGFGSAVILTGTNGVLLAVKIKTGTETAISGGRKFNVYVTLLSQGNVPTANQSLWFTHGIFGQKSVAGVRTIQSLTNVSGTYNITNSTTTVLLKATGAGHKEFDLTLPTVANEGDVIEIICCEPQNDLTLRQNASQCMFSSNRFGKVAGAEFITIAGVGHGVTTTTGAAFGSVSYYKLVLTCTEANTKWHIEQSAPIDVLGYPGVVDPY